MTAAVTLGLVGAAVALGACGGDSRSAARSDGDAPGAVVRWSRTLGGPVVPGPVLARDGLLLAADNGGTLHGLDAATGALRWRYAAGSPYGIDLSTSPLVRDGLVLWPGPNSTLYGLDLRGRLLWRHQLDSQPLTPARGRGDTIYVEESGGRLHALTVTRRGASERWSLVVGDGASYGSPAVGNDGTVYTTVGRALVAVRDAGTRARIAWRFAIAHDIEVSPAVAADGTIVLGTNDAFQYGLSPAGKVRWRVRRDAWSYSSAATDSAGRAAFGDHRGNVTTVDASGRVLSRVHGLGQIWTRPAIGRDGSVFFGTHAGFVQGFSADGRELLRLKTGGSVESYPALSADGTLFIGSEDRRIYALRPRR